jgi:hypothetical protein
VLDPEERQAILRRLRRDAAAIATAFDLSLRELRPARSDARTFYGLCDEDGRIRIRLNHIRTGRPLRYSSLINTLCHELAHLRHFHHGPAFRSFNRRMLAWARAQGIYRPRPSTRSTRVEDDQDPPLSGEALQEVLAELKGILSDDQSRSGPAPPASAPVQLGLFEETR